MNYTGLISFDDSRFNYSKKGFCSKVTGMISMANYHYVNFNNNFCVIKEDQVLKFFDPVFQNEKYDYEIGKEYLNKYFEGSLPKEKNSFDLADKKDLIRRKNILENLMILKKTYVYENEIRYKKFEITEKSLAMHIRGTDKVSEIKEIDIENIFNVIDKNIESCDFIFIFTDDQKYLNLILNKYFSNKIKYDKDILTSKGLIPIHMSGHDIDIVNGQVLQDVLLMSKFKKFAYCFSNVSELALIIGVDNFNYVVNLNTGIEGF
jgi:hypothetical protein